MRKVRVPSVSVGLADWHLNYGPFRGFSLSDLKEESQLLVGRLSQAVNPMTYWKPKGNDLRFQALTSRSSISVGVGLYPGVSRRRDK